VLAGVLLLLVVQTASVDEAEVAAQQALASGDRLLALEQFETALRAAEDTGTKARLRDAYREVGWVEPQPLNHAEDMGLALHIRNERVRLAGKAADSFAGSGKIHAAILLERFIIATMGEKTDRATKGRAKIKQLTRKLTENPTPEDRELVDQLLRAKRQGPALLKAGRKLLEQRRYRVVVRLCQQVMFGEFDQQVQNGAVALRKEAEQKAVGDATLEERQEAREVMNDTRFERLELARSRHFLYLGPRAFIDSLTGEERTLLDLAYIYQSDLAAQPLTANGVRITLYYQETFRFGGGLAGGKLIRIGDRAIRRPIAGMLHYHELGHCVFGKGWLHKGFTEGLADFAAGFTLDALGQTAAAQRFIGEAREQFVRYYLGRAIRYFRIQPYRPAAGFMFSLLPPGKAPYDWTPYRRAYHRMREAQFGAWPEREHQIMRYFGYLMSAQYGPRAFDTLQEWGWPVSRADYVRVPQEAEFLLSEVKQGDYALSRDIPQEARTHFQTVLAAAPDGPLSPRARYGLLRLAVKQKDVQGADELRARLGIVSDFKVLGPYHTRKQMAHVVFPPEEERLVHKGQVKFRHETAIWKHAKVRDDGFVDLRVQGYGYPAHACAFAVTYAHTDAPVEVRIWLGSDDGHTLYVNGALVEKRVTSRRFRFDDDFRDVTLRAGWNRILLKVHNSSGGWGFLMRMNAPDGTPLPGLRFSAADLEDRVPHFTEGKLKPVALVADEFKSLSKSRWFTAVGKFDTQNGFLRPLEKERRGLWNRFVVDPDKPATGPANLIWLRQPDLALADSLEMEIVVAAQGKDGLPRKFGFTIDGENENDGQSGHTFVLDVSQEKLRCHWYRYDRLLYLQQGVKIAPAELYRVRLRRVGSKWWLHVNDVALFDRVDAARLPALGFGVMTWGPGPRIDSIRLYRLKPSGR